MSRARLALRMGGQYQLGTGDYNQPDDKPWTGPLDGTDCAGFAICYAWKLKRHRPGFNKGSWASVEDDINVNSAMEDGGWNYAAGIAAKPSGHLELFHTMPQGSTPRPGDLLCYPTIRVKGAGNKPLTFIGHVCIVESVPLDYDPTHGFRALTVLQSHGPNGRAPGVVRTDGSIWDNHDANWPKPEHRTWIVRPHERR